MANRHTPLAARFEQSYIPEPNSGCWLWDATCDADGYGRIRRDGSTERAHRVSWSLYRGDLPDGVHVLHRCDTPQCVNPNHLFLGDNAKNIEDKRMKGRCNSPSGERQGLCRLTAQKVRAIREDLRSETMTAAAYGVSPTTVGDIRRGRTWRHIQ